MSLLKRIVVESVALRCKDEGIQDPGSTPGASTKCIYEDREKSLVGVFDGGELESIG